jgi:hypothetical protein
MKMMNQFMKDKQRVTSKDLITKLPKDFFDGEKESSKIIYATKAMTWLK